MIIYYFFLNRELGLSIFSNYNFKNLKFVGDGEVVPKGDPTHWKELDPKTMKVCFKSFRSHLVFSLY